jgi:tRNA-2-methylthio-N6-dimethylallyladenosine synthase
MMSFVTVMYGCDNYCAYCVVPYVRGRERSRKIEDVVAEVRDLAAKGRKEITLLGQNVNSYGATLDAPCDFADLLRAVSEVDGIERIRFTTSHPKDFSDRMIEAMRDLPQVCEHVHLPVQSGDDAVLKRMNRGYTSQHYLDRVAALREAVPDVAITTDFLVGFPGETEEQFENTMRLCEDLRFDAAFMFSFNPIANTAAEKLRDQVPGKVRLERLRRLIAVQNAITCEINNGQIGRVYDVLVEGVSPKDPHRLTGLTRQNKTVNFPGDASLIGSTVPIQATEGHLYGFVGKQAEVIGDHVA